MKTRNCVLYIRYSSHKQGEMSVEGQLKECMEYAERRGLTVVETYIDRAQSGRTDKRDAFLKMIKDSATRSFDYVLVWQFDRFARNRYDSAIYKRELENNGVKLISAKEEIVEGSAGVLTQGILESFSEFFSLQLSEKISRGIRNRAGQCKYLGGNVPLGFYIDSEKNFQIDKQMAPVIQEVFRKYASGETMVQICSWLNDRGVKTTRGNSFGKNSLQAMLRNKKYLGVYAHGETEIIDGIPRIIDQHTFEAVQDRLGSDQRKGGAFKVEAGSEYILTGKLYCGHCSKRMVGTSGTSRNNNIYRYYSCHAGKEGNNSRCSKKNVNKELIETKIAKACYALLTNEDIEAISEKVVQKSRNYEAEQEIRRMKKLIKEKEVNIETLMDNLESGLLVERISKRISEREQEIAQLQKAIKEEEKKLWTLTSDEVAFFLYSLRAGDMDSPKYRKKFIDAFVKKIYLYDDEYHIYFKVQDKNEDNVVKKDFIPVLNDVRMETETVYQT